MSGPKQSSVNSSNSKAKVTERVAFDPFLPQQDLINEFIRNSLTPDADYGQTYYLGRVIDIIESDNSEIDVRDVFYSPSDNYERATKALSDKKFNIKRKVLLVHVPSFLTNANSSLKKLNYNSFTKIRVDYDGKDPVEIGNLVKIQFRDKNSFYDPYIIGIENVGNDYINQIEPALKEFKKYENCKITNIIFPNTIGGISTSTNSKPSGGYSFAFGELNNVFSANYVEAFKKTITYTEFGDLDKIVIKAEEISVNSDVYVNTSLSPDYSFKVVVDDTIEKNYLIVGKEILISSEKEEKKTSLRKKFYDYVKADLESRFGFTFSYENIENTNKFNLDINLNFIVNENNKSVEQYINISNLFGDSPSIVKTNIPGKSTAETASSQTTNSTSTLDKCDAELAKDKTTYQLVYEDGKPTKSMILTDKTVLDAFYNQKITTKNYIQIDYFYKLVDKNEEQLLKINSLFYTKSEFTNDSYNLKKGQKNYLNVNDIKINFQKISSFLSKLKNQIEVIEQFETNSNNVLVLPIQVLKIKQKLNPSGKTDKNSRHYYAKAFDIRVYLKIDKKIVQIPPEVVSLYCDLQMVKDNNYIGIGVFLDGKKRYNHIEFLDSKEKMNLSATEWTQRVLYTGNSDDVEKSIESAPAGQIRVNKLKEIIRTSSNYINSTTKSLDPRFAYLIGDQ